MPIDVVHTMRPRGERIAPRHLDVWREMSADGRISGPWSEPQASERLEWNCRHWELHGHGQWLFRERDCGLLVGRRGIRRMNVHGREEVELGYSVLPELRGRGFATEMGELALHVAFARFEYPSVVAFSRADNAASRAVMRKLGFVFEEWFPHQGVPHALHRRRPAADGPG